MRVTPRKRKTHRSRLARIARQVHGLNRDLHNLCSDVICMGIRIRMLEAAAGLDPDVQIDGARKISDEMVRRCK